MRNFIENTLTAVLLFAVAFAFVYLIFGDEQFLLDCIEGVKSWIR